MATSAHKILAPEPPTDLASIPLTLSAAASTWFRLVPTPFSPLRWSRQGRYRFDSPAAKWGVCYAAESIPSAFQESWADQIRSARLDWSDLTPIIAWQSFVPPTLRTIELAGPTLTAIRGTLQCFVGNYDKSQRWGQALMAHPANLDGLQYLGRRSGRNCLALFGDKTSPKAYQPTLRVQKLGPLVTWSQLWPFLDSIKVRIAHIPAAPPAAAWS